MPIAALVVAGDPEVASARDDWQGAADLADEEQPAAEAAAQLQPDNSVRVRGRVRLRLRG